MFAIDLSDRRTVVLDANHATASFHLVRIEARPIPGHLRPATTFSPVIEELLRLQGETRCNQEPGFCFRGEKIDATAVAAKGGKSIFVAEKDSVLQSEINNV